MAFKTFTSGAVLTAAELNTYLMQQAVIVCTAATRPSSPVEGMVIYETDTDQGYQYDGSNWIQTSELGAWTSYTPTLGGTGWAIGDGTITGSYTRIARTVFFQAAVTFGASSTYGAAAAPTISLPVTATGSPIITCRLADATGAAYLGACPMSASTVTIQVQEVSGSYVRYNNVLDIVPFTWTTSDAIGVSGTYQAAASS